MDAAPAPSELSLPLELYLIIKDFLPQPYQWVITLNPSRFGQGFQFKFAINQQQHVKSSFKSWISQEIEKEEFPYLREQVQAASFIRIVTPGIAGQEVASFHLSKTWFSLKNPLTHIFIDESHPQFAQLNREIRQAFQEALQE